MAYDISADYVDSTTTYEPRSTIIDSDFIGGHSKFENEFYSFFLLRFIDLLVHIKCKNGKQNEQKKTVH